MTFVTHTGKDFLGRLQRRTLVASAKVQVRAKTKQFPDYISCTINRCSLGQEPMNSGQVISRGDQGRLGVFSVSYLRMSDIRHQGVTEALFSPPYFPAFRTLTNTLSRVLRSSGSRSLPMAFCMLRANSPGHRSGGERNRRGPRKVTPPTAQP